MNLKDLKNKDRPRERLVELGPRALSDVELLAILIGSGTKECTVLDIASQLLSQYSITELKELSFAKLIRLKGIKKAKACLLLACFELARRGSQSKLESPSLENAKDIYAFAYKEFYLESNEVCMAILTDCKLKPIKTIVERGDSAHQVGLPMKRIVSEALDVKAFAVILLHNHPSGEVEPSDADVSATHQLQRLLFPLDILLLDHLVVSGEEFFSMHEHGLLTLGLEYSVLGDSF